jgi:4-amino-4-deoxy-L-arabinose transferase
LFFIILYIIPLGSRPMIAPAEFEYAQTAVDMVELSMYTADGGVIAPDTPPMSHWITAASFNLFGINNFAARLPSALAVGITALMIALLVQQNLRDEKLAALASMIFMSFSLVLLAGSTAQPVMLTVMTISGTLGTIFLAVQEKQINRRKIMLLILAGLFAAAGFLTAGFPALVLPLLIVVSYLINSRQLKELALILPIVIISMILPVLPWLIKMSDNCGLFCNFVSFSIFYDSFGSYSWFCYAVLLAAGCCPVWILFPCAILTGKESWIRLFRQPICKFATAALLIPLIYFTICRNENPAMILICFPALSLLIPLGIQAYFNNGGHHRSFDWMLNFWALLLLVCGFTAVGLWFFPAYAAVIMEKLRLVQKF